MAIDNKMSLVDAYGKATSQTSNDINIGNITVGSGTVGTGRGFEAGMGVTISSPTTTTTPTSTTPTTTSTTTTSTSTSSTDLSGSFTTSTPTTNFAASQFGDLELTKYLYESGLQNIFSDYQRNIQTLQQDEAQQLQQAYAIREMSKKYLGEYASNVGIGDVSGNLLDIYSQYAANISNIEQNFAALEMNLTREYTMERMNTFNEILKTQYQIDVAQLDTVAAEASQYVFTEFDNDVQGGLAYLDSQQTNMRPEDYEIIRDSYYQAQVSSAKANISSDNPYFGFSDLETKTLKSQEQYLEEVKQWMQPDDYRELEEIIALKELIATNEGEVDFGEPLTNVNASIYTSDPLVDENSLVYQLGGLRFATANVSIADDDVAYQNNITVDLLNQQFVDQTGMEVSEVSEGDIVQYQGYYIYKDNQWTRMIGIGTKDSSGFEDLTKDQLSTWSKGSDETPFGDVNLNFDYGEEGQDAITYQGKTYVEDNTIGEYKDYFQSSDIPMNSIIDYLNTTFGEYSDLTPEEQARGVVQSSNTEVSKDVPKGLVFFYQGKFYVYTQDGKKIRPMNLETTNTQ